MSRRRAQPEPAVELSDEAINAQLDRSRRELARKAVQYGSDALETLHKVSEDSEAPASSRVSAARSILDQAMGRPQVREPERGPAGNVVIIQINQLSAPDAPLMVETVTAERADRLLGGSA